MPGKGKRIKSGEKRLVVRIFNYFVGENSKSKGKKGGLVKTPLQKTITITGKLITMNEKNNYQNLGFSKTTVLRILSEYECLSTEDDFVSPAKRYKCSRTKVLRHIFTQIHY